MLTVFQAELNLKASGPNKSDTWFWVRTTALTAWCALGEHAALAGDILALRRAPERRDRRQRRFAAIRAQLVSDVREARHAVERRRIGSFAFAGVSAGLAAVALAALGIARAGLFSVPYPAADRLVVIESDFLDQQYENFPLTGHEYLQLADQATSYDAIGAWAYVARTIDLGGQKTRERIVWATPGAFDTFGLDTPEARREGEPRPVYVSAEFWRERLFADPAAVGRLITVDGFDTRIVGVLPSDFEFWIGDISLWIPFQARAVPGQDSNHMFGAVARLAPGVSLEEARREAVSLSSSWPGQGSIHGFDPRHPLRVERLTDRLAGADGQPMRLLIMLAGGLLALGLVHLIGMGRPAGLRETRLRPQFLARGFLLTAGSTVGLCAALVVLGVWTQARFDPFRSGTGANMAGTVLLFGITLAVALAATAAALSARRSRRLGGALVALDLAAAVGLLFGAGLLLRSAVSLAGDDPGFRPEGLVAFDAVIPPRNGSDLSAEEMASEVVRFSRSLPGARLAALTSGLPVSPGMLPSNVVGRESGSTTERASQALAQTYFVSEGYTEVLGAPLVAGRRIEGPGEAVLSVTLANRLWPGGRAVNNQVHSKILDKSAGYARVVGIVSDVPALAGSRHETAQLYVSRDMVGEGERLESSFTVLIRSDDSGAAATHLPAGLMLRGTSVPISRPIRVSDWQRIPIRKHSFLLGILAGASLLCMALGLLTARLVGAEGKGLSLLFKALIPGLPGGLAAAVWVRRFLDPLLFETRQPDIAVFLVVAASVAALTLLSTAAARHAKPPASLT